MLQRIGVRLVVPLIVAVIVAAVTTGAASARPRYSSDLFAVGDNFTLGGTAYSGSMIGLGYRFNGLFSGKDNLGWSIGGQYTKGMAKTTLSSGTGASSSTTELDPSAYAFYFQVNHYYDCCDFDCGPEIYYERTTLLQKETGAPDDKLSGIDMFGIGGHFGGTFPLSKKVGVFGEYSEIFGYRTYDEKLNGNETKYSAWTFQPNYRAGFRYGF